MHIYMRRKSHVCDFCTGEKSKLQKSDAKPFDLKEAVVIFWKFVTVP